MRKLTKVNNFNRSGYDYLKEAQHLRKLRQTLDLDYELDQEISSMLRERRKVLLEELESSKVKQSLQIVK